MPLKFFLTFVAAGALAIGSVAAFAPEFLLAEVKQVAPEPVALVMARTVGVLLLTVGALNAMVRTHRWSPTLRAVLVADLLLQVLIVPIDPLAFLSGTFQTLGSFLPNTLLHVVVASGCVYYLRSEAARSGMSSARNSTESAAPKANSPA